MDSEKKNSFVGYEYRDVVVKRDMESVYVDAYQSFGWDLDNTSNIVFTSPGSVGLKFKRDRKIKNKAELARLQRQFESTADEIEQLEAKKASKAMGISLLVGLAGTAFMAGSVFAVLANSVVLCIILAIPAFIGWALGYFLNKRIAAKTTTEVAPLIDQKYDTIYKTCEQAHALLA